MKLVTLLSILVMGAAAIFGLNHAAAALAPAFGGVGTQTFIASPTPFTIGTAAPISGQTQTPVVGGNQATGTPCALIDQAETGEEPETALCLNSAQVDVETINGQTAVLSAAKVGDFSNSFSPMILSNNSGSGEQFAVPTAGPLSTPAPVGTQGASVGGATTPTASGTVINGTPVPFVPGTATPSVATAVPELSPTPGLMGGNPAVTPSPALQNNSGTGMLFNPALNVDGNAVTIALTGGSVPNNGAAQLEICFQDPSGTGTVYQWYSADMWSVWYGSNTTAPRWVNLPTWHANGMACGQSWLVGTFTIH